MAVQIEPALPCHWRWLNVSALACQLDADQALLPATRYRVTVAAGFAAADGARLARQVVHEFVTERPRLEQAYVSAWRGPGSPVLRLQFNLPVTRQSVEQALRFQPAGGEPVGPVLGEISSGRPPEGAALLPLPGEQLFILATPQAAEPEAGPARRYWDVMPGKPLAEGVAVDLQLRAGLITPHGQLPGREQRQALQLHTFPAFRFLGVRCHDEDGNELLLPPGQAAAAACNPMQPVALAFSAPVLSDQIREHVRITPDLAAGRKDYDPWQNQRSYSALSGPYRPGKEYRVYLPERLQARQEYRFAADGTVHDEFGRPLENALVIEFRIGPRPPNLALIYRRAVVESQVANDVPLTVTNLRHLDVRYSSLTAAGALPEQTVRLPLPAVPDIAFHYPLGLWERLGGRSGAISGEILPEPRFPSYRPEDYRFFAQATPYQLHVKLGHFNSLVWVTDLASGAPVVGAEVQVYLGDYQRLQPTAPPLAEARTDADGIALLPGRQQLDPQLEHAYAWEWDKPRLFVQVTRGEDFALLPLDFDFEIASGEVTDWSIHGWPRAKAGFVRAWRATAQGVYRLGDSIQYKLYVRDQDHRGFIPAPSGPYRLRIVDPTGKLLHEADGIQLDGFGSLAGEYRVPPQGATGWYRFELAADFLPEPLPVLEVLVADFAVASFKVSSQLNGELFRSGDRVQVATQASMHAGGPYADAQARVTARLYPRPLQPAASTLRGFYFQTLRDNQTPETVFQTEGQLDLQGRLDSSFTLQAEHVLYGRLDVESAVSDERGALVSGFASALYAGRDRYVGLRQQSWLLRQGEPALVDVAVIAADGEPVAGVAVTVRIEHEEVTAARVKGAGNAFITRYNRAWRETDRCRLQSAAAAVTCRFVPPAPGRYRLLAEIRDSQGRPHTTEIQLWAAGRGQVVWEEPPGKRLDIVPERESYQVGETARYLIRNPLPGANALITVERYGLLQQWVQRLEGSTPVLELPITEDMIPGFYLSVVAVSPRVATPPDDDGVDLGRPTLRMGYVQTRVVDAHKQLQIEARPARPTYRPGERVRLELQARPRHGEPEPVQLAVVVLDEAVFDQLRDGERSFDPYRGFYRLEPLDLANYSLLNCLIGLQKFEKKGANAGGDGGDVDARRIERYVAYWNPAVAVDARGMARLKFDAPDNLTGWRVLVLGATGKDRFGLGQTRFQVNQPIEIRPVMPNLLRSGDRFLAGFSVMNRSDREREFGLRWQVEGPAKVLAPAALESRLRLLPYQRQTVYLPLESRQAGQLRITLSAAAGAERDALRHELLVRPAVSLHTAANHGSLDGGSIVQALHYPAEFEPAAGGLSVVLSPTIIGNLDGVFRYLCDYPYGGWEQLLGRAVLAAQYQALRHYLPPALDWPEAATLPAAVLEQAASFQAPNGGMAFFRAEDAYASPYLSAYTALAFNWLRAAGETVPALVEQRLLDYLDTLLRRDFQPELHSPGMAATVRAVALAALAEQGRLSRADLERYRRHVPAMSLFGQAHYLQALLAVEDTAELRREVLQYILARAVQDGGRVSFNEALDDGYVRILATPLRSQCAVLSALVGLAAKPDGAALAAELPSQLVGTIVEARGSRDHWENTQENLFCLQALLAYGRAYEQGPIGLQARVSLDGEPLAVVRFQSSRDPSQELVLPMRSEDAGRQRRLRLEHQGQGRLYYGVRLSHALPARAQQAANAGIELRREYSVRRAGQWQLLASPLQLRRGELVRVDLYLSLPTARHFVVVDDPVPGGLEPVNRKLATASTVDAVAAAFPAAGGSWYLRHSDWIGYDAGRWSFHHQELRHDAVRFYADYLPAGNYHLSYTAQVIADGEFLVPSARAEEMYAPAVFGRTAPARLLVGEGDAGEPKP